MMGDRTPVSPAARPAEFPRGPDRSARVHQAASIAHEALHRAGARQGPVLRLLGAGVDAVSFVTGDLVISVRPHQDVHRQARLLKQLSTVSLPVPTPTVAFVDPHLRVLATTLLTGSPLLGRRPPPGIGTALGAFLHRLHTAALDPHDTGLPREPFDVDEWTADLTGPGPLVRRTLAQAPHQLGTPLVLCHADLGAEHLLVRDGHLAGVIDWADACYTDPARDFARILRDFGPPVLRQALDAYGPPARHVDLRAVTFFARCAALEDLRFSATPRNAAYGVAARRSLRWLFPPRAATRRRVASGGHRPRPQADPLRTRRS